MDIVKNESWPLMCEPSELNINKQRFEVLTTHLPDLMFVGRICMCLDSRHGFIRKCSCGDSSLNQTHLRRSFGKCSRNICFFAFWGIVHGWRCDLGLSVFSWFIYCKRKDRPAIYTQTSIAKRFGTAATEDISHYCAQLYWNNSVHIL